jgi:hypothetical protein
VTARPATSPARQVVGVRDLKIARNSQRSIAVRSVIRDGVSDLSLANVVICSAPEDVLDRNNPIAW